jgi:aminobenzoyl-glutamate transport protein
MTRTEKKGVKTGGRFNAFIDKVEWLGNKLPHPFWLFVSLCGIVMVLSFILSELGVSIEYAGASGAAGQTPGPTEVSVVNLLGKSGIRYVFVNLTDIYASFAPLSLVMIMMIGVGFLEKSGMLNALIRKTIIGVDPSWIVVVVAIIAVNGNLASDAGVIIVPTLAGAIWKSMGKHPWVGIIAAYVAVNGGFSANLLIAGTDVLLAGITESVTSGLGMDVPVHPMMNWYFMCASTIVIVGGTILVTVFFTEKRLGSTLPELEDEDAGNDSGQSLQECTPRETRGLKLCAVAAVVYVLLVVFMVLPSDSFLRADDGSLLPKSPLLDSIVTLLLLLFFVLGMTYGKATGSIERMKDVPKMMSHGLEGALGFMVIALPAAVFIELFNQSNISVVAGVSMGNLIAELNVGGLPMLLLFILVCTITNLLMTSNSAKWLIMAPIFIPMLSVIDISPAMVQATYRIGDMSTNIISPIDYYIPVIMGLLAMYRPKGKEVGLGTVISLCLPYSIVFMTGMITLLCIWYAFGLPLGPGAPMFLGG